MARADRDHHSAFTTAALDLHAIRHQAREQPQWQRMAALSFVDTAFGSLRSGSRIYATAFLRSSAIHSEVATNTQSKNA